MTNLDRIREMTADELAEFLEEIECGECRYCAYQNESCMSLSCKMGYKKFLESECEKAGEG